MKWLISIIVVASCNGCALATLPTSKFTVHITDVESGVPITNAVVETTFEHKYDPWGGDNIVDRRKEGVAGNGVVVFEGKDIGGSFGAAVCAEGYYQDWAGLEKRKKNIVLNRWEPWNPTFEVKMRPKKNPVPMVQKRMEWKQIPEMNKPVGFDFEVGDWTAPHGKGKVSDFILTASGYYHDSKKGSEARYVLSFSNENDGIQAYRFPEDLRSSFKWLYDAPLDGYQPFLEKYKHWDLNGTPDKTNYNGKDKFIFRVRSRKFKDGTIVGCYGMLSGEIEFIPQGKIRFGYWFNPVPNERSLEWNGVNLLKKK